MKEKQTRLFYSMVNVKIFKAGKNHVANVAYSKSTVNFFYWKLVVNLI